MRVVVRHWGNDRWAAAQVDSFQICGSHLCVFVYVFFVPLFSWCEHHTKHIQHCTSQLEIDCLIKAAHSSFISICVDTEMIGDICNYAEFLLHLVKLHFQIKIVFIFNDFQSTGNYFRDYFRTSTYIQLVFPITQMYKATNRNISVASLVESTNIKSNPIPC